MFLVFFHLFFLLSLSSDADDLSVHVAIQCHTHYKSRYFLHNASKFGFMAATVIDDDFT